MNLVIDTPLLLSRRATPDGVYFLPATDLNHPLRAEFHQRRVEMFVGVKGYERSPADERTWHDDTADFFVCVRGGVVRAGCRIIHKERTGRLPAEDYLNTEVTPGAVEISRMLSFTEGLACVRTLRRLFSAMALYFVDNSIPQVVMVIDHIFLEKLQRIGLKIFDPLPAAEVLQKGESTFPPHQINLAAMRAYFSC